MTHATFTQPPAPKRPVFKRKGFWIGVAVVVALGAAVNATDDSASTDAKPKPAVTVTKTASPDADKALKDVQDSNKQGQDDLQKEIDEAAESAKAAAPEMGDLPSFVGMSHQDAQDTAQAAGFFNLREKDASGMERLMILDRNWKVCKQEPAPGEHALEKTITLYSVKNDESC